MRSSRLNRVLRRDPVLPSGAAVTPLTILGPNRLRAWFSADDVAGADGSNIATLVDKSGNGNDAAAFAGGVGGTVEAGGWGGRRSILQTSQAFSLTGSSAVGVFNGTTRPFTVIMAAQVTSSSALNQFWSAGALTATNEYLVIDAGSNVRQRMVQRFGAAGGTADNGVEDILQTPQVYFWARDGSGNWLMRRDGLDETTFTRTDGGLLCERIMIGGFSQGTSAVANARQRWRHWLLVEGLVTDAERTALEQWLAGECDLRWKRGLGGTWTGTTYVMVGMGQSNQLGYGSAPYTSAPDSKYLSLNRGKHLKTLADPVSAGTSYDVYPTFTALGQGSMWPAFCNDLDAYGFLGADDRLIVVDCSIGSQSADNWHASYNVSPPVAGTLFGITKLSVEEVMRNAPNPVLLGVVIHQGESESTNATEASEWGTVNWDPNCTEWISWTSTAGYSWASTKRFVVTQLPETAWTGGAFWADVRTSQAAMVAGRTDAVLYRCVDGPWTDGTFIHIETAAQDVKGAAIGAIVRNLGDSPAELVSSVPVVAWWRWDRGVTVETGVARWEDQGPNGFDFTQSSAGLQPTLSTSGGANGQGYITGDGSDDLLTTAMNLDPPGTTPYRVFAVIRRESFVGGAVIFDSGSTVFELRESSNVALSMRNTALVNTNSNAPLATWVLVEVLFNNATTDTLRIAGVDVTGALAGNSNPGAKFGLFGQSSGGANSNTSVAELFVTEGTPTEIADVRAYFATKYGVAT